MFRLSIKIFSLLLILNLLSIDIYAQYPVNYFAPPLRIPMELSGNFCEIRSNHFHAGLDIRTQGRKSVDVQAAANGFVSRIKVSFYGYGKAIYITHPNGYTSVYAHLSKFSGAIADSVMLIQTAKQSYQIDHHFAANVLPVKKGQIIGLSGNTGSSGGPHLHFEIRDSKTEEIINPLLFGYKFADTRNPVIKNILLYPLTDKSLINGENKMQRFDVDYADGKYYVEYSSNINIKGWIGAAIEGYDYKNDNRFYNGFSKITVQLGDSLLYNISFDRIAFKELRFVNSHIDYAEKLATGNEYRCLWQKPGDKLRNYKTKNKGYIGLPKGATSKLNITAYDDAGNTTQLQLNLKSFGKSNKLPYSDTVATIKHNQSILLSRQFASVFINSDCLYKNLKIFPFRKLPEKGPSGFSYIKIGYAQVPIHRDIIIKLKVPAKAKQKQKLCLSYRRPSGGFTCYGGKLTKNGFIEAETNDFGNYTLIYDTIAPEIKIKNMKENTSLSQFERIAFIINDNFSGIKSYKAFIDGNYFLMAYEYKNNSLFGNLPALETGQHNFKLKLLDKRRNLREFSCKFSVR